MDKVCFGAAGFSLKCGRHLLAVNRQRADYQVRGRPFGAFFQWAGLDSHQSHPLCRPSLVGAQLDMQDTPPVRGKSSSLAQNKTLEQEQRPNEAGTAFRVGIIAISS